MNIWIRNLTFELNFRAKYGKPQKLFVSLHPRKVNSKKKMTSRFIYTMIWSLLLLYSSFPGLFSGELDFSFQDQWNESARKYIVILIMAVVLFIVDAVYNLLKTKNNFTPFILSGAAVFLLCMALSLSYCGSTFFIVGWVVLTAMKFFTTESIEHRISFTYQPVSED